MQLHKGCQVRFYFELQSPKVIWLSSILRPILNDLSVGENKLTKKNQPKTRTTNLQKTETQKSGQCLQQNMFTKTILFAMGFGHA